MAAAVHGCNRPTPKASIAPPAKPRFAALDAVRGGAMLLGIVLHAAISYMPGRMPELAWGIYDDATNPVFDGLFWWIHSFRLPLFFAIAGFFASLLYESRGPRHFLRHRVRRLLLPFLIGSLIVVPVGFLYAWTCRSATGALADASLLAFVCDRGVLRELLGPSHLWFLEDLFILSLLFLGARRLTERWKIGRRVEIGLRVPSLLWPIALTVPTAAILCLDLRVFVAHHNSFVPGITRLAYYGYCFVVGTFLYRHRVRLPEIFGAPLTHLGLSLLTTTAMMALLSWYLAGPMDSSGNWWFAVVVALQVWLTIFALVGLALRWCNGGHPMVRYLADASFWIYLCHLPLVGFLQLALHRLILPAMVKFLIVVVVTAAVALLSYHAFGRRKRRKSLAGAAGSAQDVGPPQDAIAA